MRIGVEVEGVSLYDFLLRDAFDYSLSSIILSITYIATVFSGKIIWWSAKTFPLTYIFVLFQEKLLHWKFVGQSKDENKVVQVFNY